MPLDGTNEGVDFFMGKEALANVKDEPDGSWREVCASTTRDGCRRWL